MNTEQQHRLTLPTFYPYPLQDGEKPLQAMRRWAEQVQAKERRSTMISVKRADWVKVEGSSLIGLVRRVACNGEWADVDWHTHTKRMRTSVLQVQTTIPIGVGGTVTDLTRQQEIEKMSNS